MKPTEEAYQEFQTAFAFFNGELFDGKLPAVLLTFQRKPRTCGYFSSERFVNGTGVRVDEIAMNPSHFAVTSPVEVMQTLVHEMVHMWQFHFGKPGRRRYHNLEWADFMESIGLMPSDTGKPGGNRVGEAMADYVIEGGRFDVACKTLLTGPFGITWKDRFPDPDMVRNLLAEAANGAEGSSEILAGLEALGILAGSESEEGGEAIAAPSSSNRRKYQCPGCKANAWGKPGLQLACVPCGVELVDIGT